MNVYLAGPITGLHFDEAKDWRDSFIDRLAAYGWKGLSPMRDKEAFRIKGKLNAFFDEGAAAVERDLQDIRESRAVILNVLGADSISLGTMAEMGYAYAEGKPIILVTDGEANPHHHVFTEYMATFVVSSLDDALRILVNMEAHVRVPYAPPVQELVGGGVSCQT